MRFVGLALALAMVSACQGQGPEGNVVARELASSQLAVDRETSTRPGAGIDTAPAARHRPELSGPIARVAVPPVTREQRRAQHLQQIQAQADDGLARLLAAADVIAVVDLVGTQAVVENHSVDTRIGAEPFDCLYVDAEPVQVLRGQAGNQRLTLHQMPNSESVPIQGRSLVFLSQGNVLGAFSVRGNRVRVGNTDLTVQEIGERI